MALIALGSNECLAALVAPYTPNAKMPFEAGALSVIVDPCYLSGTPLAQ